MSAFSPDQALRGICTYRALVACVLMIAMAPLCGEAQPVQVQQPEGQTLDASKLPWNAPRAAQMQFEVQGKLKGLPYRTTARIDWRPSGQRYEASQELQVPLLGGRRQSSVGALTAQGLQPEVFMDRSRREYSTTFDASAGIIRFSRGDEPVAWVRGIQDRLSVFFQVAGLIAAAPERYPQGTRITVQTASTHHVTPWVFQVQAKEKLSLPAGVISALKLEHLDAGKQADNREAANLQSALWLAPSLHYLPVRIRLVENERDELDLRLKSHIQP